jgi:hypothetical protein
MKGTGLKFGPLGMRFDDSYRTVPEPRIIKSIMFAGWTHEADTPLAIESSKKSLQEWVGMGLAFKTAPSGERLFDPVEVGNFMKSVGLAGRDAFLSERYVTTHRRMVLELANSSRSGERKFDVEFKRTFRLRSIPAGTKLRLRAPSPLAGNYLKEIEVKPFAETAGESRITRGPGRLELRMVAGGEDEATLGATWSFTVRLQEPRAGDAPEEPDRAVYLSEREGLVAVTDRIRALAHSLAGSGASAPETVRAFWNYINDTLIFGAIHYDQIDAAAPCDWTLDSGWFDCQLGASLFIALCRARGIPARLVTGYLLYRVAPVKHFWAEVWFEDRGWTPIDLIGWDLCQGDLDPVWRDRFYGRLDYRLICERLPREFTGALGVPIPPAWYLHSTSEQGGVEARFIAIDGTPIYTDTTRITGWFTG